MSGRTRRITFLAATAAGILAALAVAAPMRGSSAAGLTAQIKYAYGATLIGVMINGGTTSVTGQGTVAATVGSP